MSQDVRPTRIIGEENVEGSARHLVLDYDSVDNLTLGDTTPSVRDRTKFKANGLVTITNFLHGAAGQLIHILGDGNTTIGHTATIKRSSGVDGLLVNEVVYSFLFHAGMWYEVCCSTGSGGGGGVPAAHHVSHENGGIDEINVVGLSGLLADPQTPLAHKVSHQNGGSDEISVAGLSGLLGDAQTPLAHKTSHQSGGSDAIKLDDLAATDDNTDLDSSTSAHGLLKKLPGNTTTFLRGDGTFATPAGSAGEDWQVISVQSASDSATIDFTGIDPAAWDELELTALDVVSATDNVDLWLRIGTGATPTWATGASDYSFVKHGVFGTTGAGTGFTAADTTFDAMQFAVTGISNVAGEMAYASLFISGLASGVYCQCRGIGSTFMADNGHVVAHASGRYNATTAITALRVMASTGNITSGKFILRGRAVT